MKTYKKLFDEICTFPNLYTAYNKAKKNKRYRDYVLQFSWELERNLFVLQRELKDKTYKHGEYNEFVIHDAKKRNIKAAPFRDRIVHHALCNIIDPILDKGFIYDSYACRVDKGTHKAIAKLEKHLKLLDIKSESGNTRFYYLQCDISKYFDNIDHQILKELLKSKIVDEDVNWLLSEIIDSSGNISYGESLFDIRSVGIPIGNLTSQLFANFYLNPLDQFIKHELSIKYYLRYMDDFLILSEDKKYLHIVKQEIIRFIESNLRLIMNPKKVHISPVNVGIDFLGYRIWHSHKLLRKSTVKRFIVRTKKATIDLQNNQISETKYIKSIRSWDAYARYANSYKLRQSLYKGFNVKIHL